MKKLVVGESGQPSEFHAITELAVDREAGVATIVLTSWSDLGVAMARGASVDRRIIDMHVGTWSPEMAFQLLGLLTTLPPWVGAEILDQD